MADNQLAADLQRARDREQYLSVEIITLQRRLDAEVNQRGGWGPNARRLDSQLQELRNDFRQAQADARTLQAERRALQAASDAERAFQRSPAEQYRQLALTIGAPVAGFAIGKYAFGPELARGYQRSIQASNVELRRVAAIAANAMASGRTDPSIMARLRGAVRTADTLRIGSPYRSLALATAAILVGEGLYLRAAAGGIENETGSEVTRSAGTALMFGGAAAASAQLVKLSQSRTLVDAGAKATVEIAREFAGEGTMHRRVGITAAQALNQTTRAALEDTARRRGVVMGDLTKRGLAGRLARDMSLRAGASITTPRAVPVGQLARGVVSQAAPGAISRVASGAGRVVFGRFGAAATALTAVAAGVGAVALTGGDFSNLGAGMRSSLFGGPRSATEPDPISYRPTPAAPADQPARQRYIKADGTPGANLTPAQRAAYERRRGA